MHERIHPTLSKLWAFSGRVKIEWSRTRGYTNNDSLNKRPTTTTTTDLRGSFLCIVFRHIIRLFIFVSIAISTRIEWVIIYKNNSEWEQRKKNEHSHTLLCYNIRHSAKNGFCCWFPSFVNVILHAFPCLFTFLMYVAGISPCCDLSWNEFGSIWGERIVSFFVALFTSCALSWSACHFLTITTFYYGYRL